VVSTQSGALDKQPYGFNTRFEDKPGTNPEELIGAAHASCYAMAMSLFLGEAGFTADQMDTQSDVVLEQDGAGFSVKTIHLSIKAKIPKIDEAKFQEVAKAAKENCPISKLLTAKISLDAALVS
jgi:peroxiredoxin, OsmC subfamily